MKSAKGKRRLVILAAAVAAYVAGTIIATRQGYSFALAHHDVPVP